MLTLALGRYDEKELNESYIGNVHRHNLIYKYVIDVQHMLKEMLGAMKI